MPLSNVVIDLYHGDAVDALSGFHDIKADGIKAVIHKATEGSHYQDPTYASRRCRALSVGLLWGSYHFGVSGDPQKQAEYYLSIAQPQDGEVICLDFEASSQASSMSLSDAESFVEHIHLKTNQYPILYSGQSFLSETLGQTKASETILSQCPLWIARYSAQPPQLPPGIQRLRPVAIHWRWRGTATSHGERYCITDRS